MIHKGENWTLKRVLHILQGNKNKQLLGSPPSLISVQWGLLSSWKRSILKLSSFLTRVHIRPYSVHPIADQKIMDTSHHQRGLHEEEYRLHLLLQWRHTWWRRRIWIRRHQRPVHQMERDASRKQSGRKLFLVQMPYLDVFCCGSYSIELFTIYHHLHGMIYSN